MINEPVNFNPEFTPEQFVEQIDLKYDELKGKEDRLSLKWGHFSRGMNIEIRRYLEQLPVELPLYERYHYVQIYWTCRSRLLDLHMKHKLVSQGRRKRENKMANDIKDMILNHKPLRPVSESEIIAGTLKRL